MKRPLASAASLVLLLACAGCDPAVIRTFDVRLADQPRVSKGTQSVVTIEGELAEVVRIMNDVAATWDFRQERSYVDETEDAAEAAGEMGPDRTVGHWYRPDPSGAGLSLRCRLVGPERARVYLVRAIHAKESPLMRDIRHDLTARLNERFGGANVRVSGNMDVQSLRN